MSDSESDPIAVLDEEFHFILKSPLLQHVFDGNPLDKETGPLFVRLNEVISALAGIAAYRRVDSTPMRHFRDLVSDLVAGKSMSVSAQELNAAALRASNLVRDLFYAPRPEAIPGFALPETITLAQAAALVNRSPAGLRHYRTKGMPKPLIRGKKGQPNEYRLSEIRPWLEKTFNRPIPDIEIRRFRAPGD
jgi:hypothetical protein